MADSDRLKPYTPATALPKRDADIGRFIMDELRKVQQADTQTLEVLRALEARIAALEP